MRLIITALVICLVLPAPLIADTIYIWTDKDGVKRFSNEQPEGVEDYETVQSVESENDADNNARPGLKKMVSDVEAQNRAADERKANENARKQREKTAQESAEKEAANSAERARLQKKIDELNNRALGPTFTQGMRESQIKEIQKQIDALE